jgi:hypothetical protein
MMDPRPARPRVLFFARGYQADFFPTLLDATYEAVFVTLTTAERKRVEAAGGAVAACFEEQFDRLAPATVDESYLETSLPADRFLGRFDNAQRREILGKEIAFWRGLLKQYRPAAVVNELVAIEISEVLLMETRRAGVRYLAGMNCVVDDYFYWLVDPMTLSGRCLRLPEPEAAHRELATAYVQQALDKNYLPFYVQNLAGRRALMPFVTAAVKYALWSWRRVSSRWTGRFRYEMYQEEYGKRLEVFVKSLFVRYDKLESLPPGAEVVFYPLHQEPEATLNYMSAFYSNQVATIENILKCLTPGQVLVVKEHPVDKGALLRGKFRRIRKENSSLYCLPAEVHGRLALARASRVVTLTSTVGWEAAILGKPVYVLGQIFYDHCDRVVRVGNWDELRGLLRSPAQGSGDDRAGLIDFVARMVAGSYPGNPFPHAKLYSDENRQRVIAAIRDAAGI